MALIKIVYHPEPVLRRVSSRIEVFDAALQKLIDDMFETMYAADGVGLAANQIGLAKRLAIIDVTSDRSQQYVLANPEIVAVSDEQETFQEGCLSVPGVYDTVTRAKWVKIRAQDRQGKHYELEGTGVLGECIQHEIQHLDGKLFVDLLSSLKKQRALKKSEKYIKYKS